MSEYILETVELSKSFKGFKAVDNVNLRVQLGHIHALIGPNGAGKTTCFNLLTKFINPTAGRIFFDGEDITADKPYEIARKGIIRSFQISAVFPQLTVINNIRVALQRKAGHTYDFWRSEKVLDRLNDKAESLLAEVDLSGFENEVTVNLPYGRKRALEVATTLAMEPRIMLLDEPTQGMGMEDVERVTKLIKKVSLGRTVLMVEHNMQVVASIADRITVLSQGAVLAEGDYSEVSSDQKVIEAYMGSTEHELDGTHK